MPNDESADGTQAFLGLVKEVDAAVQVVIPTAPSNSSYLISLTKGANRKFISVSEDDLLDLVHEPTIRAQVATVVKAAIAAL